MNLRNATGAEVRRHIRAREWTAPTPGLALGYVQANLVVVPKDLAFDFLLFCQRNPRPCPVLDVTEPGDPEPRLVAPGSDLRTDVPRYCVYRDGRLAEERDNLLDLWRPDFVGFLLGCSFTFENALLAAGVPVRHLDLNCNVPMFRTSIDCQRAGPFHGPLVVSMRPMTPAQAIRAVEICSRFPRAHGAPVHIGDPQAIGVKDLGRPDYGDPVPVHPGEVPVFWACGVTPQAVVTQARPPLVITHKPGHMFVSDWRDVDLT
ncbi:MAG: putative hydro-lyase [Gemmataceae bacterium]